MESGRCVRDDKHGGYSPTLLNINDFDLEIQKTCTYETDDWKKLQQQRESVVNSWPMKVRRDFVSFDQSRSRFDCSSMSKMVSKVLFVIWCQRCKNQYLWSDKYRPIKPRVYNKFNVSVLFVYETCTQLHFLRTDLLCQSDWSDKDAVLLSRTYFFIYFYSNPFIFMSVGHLRE